MGSLRLACLVAISVCLASCAHLPSVRLGECALSELEVIVAAIRHELDRDSVRVIGDYVVVYPDVAVLHASLIEGRPSSLVRRFLRAGANEEFDLSALDWLTAPSFVRFVSSEELGVIFPNAISESEEKDAFESAFPGAVSYFLSVSVPTISDEGRALLYLVKGFRRGHWEGVLHELGCAGGSWRVIRREDLWAS